MITILVLFSIGLCVLVYTYFMKKKDENKKDEDDKDDDIKLILTVIGWFLILLSVILLIVKKFYTHHSFRMMNDEEHSMMDYLYEDETPTYDWPTVPKKSVSIDTNDWPTAPTKVPKKSFTSQQIFQAKRNLLAKKQAEKQSNMMERHNELMNRMDKANKTLKSLNKR